MMLRTHDNWERLVAATLKRQEIWELCHAPSISVSSRSSYCSSLSLIPDFPLDNISHSNSDCGSFNSDDLEVGPIFGVEPESIVVNGKPLDSRELNILLCCRDPPKKLKPGYYWYDKFAGFWGKEGRKPSQIVSANLDVGGCLKREASNGNTCVGINGREITKVELFMLKSAGVRCYPDTNFWMNHDGSYQEEGHNVVKGAIWDKAGTRLVCSLLALPFPPQSSYASGCLSVLDAVQHEDVKKFVLIGCSGSGTSTIFTQAKFLYKLVPFMEDELKNIKFSIRSNTYGYIRILLESRQPFEDKNFKGLKRSQRCDEQGITGYANSDAEKSIYSSRRGSRAFADRLHDILESDRFDFSSSSLIQECAPLVEDLWRDSAFQEILKWTTELGRLPVVAIYFLERAVDVFRPSYEPSRMDILYAEGFASSLLYMDFSFPQSNDDDTANEDQQDFMQKYRLIRSPTRAFEESREWLVMSKDVRVVIFSLSLDTYDQFTVDENGALVNKMKSDIEYFASIVTRPSFSQACFLLLLTNYSLFEEKIEQSPLNRCEWFEDFHRGTSFGVETLETSLGQKGFSYISVKFKRIYAGLTGRKLYVKEVNTLDENSIDAALRYAKEILTWDEEKNDYFYADDSSLEESSYFEESE